MPERRPLDARTVHPAAGANSRPVCRPALQAGTLAADRPQSRPPGPALLPVGSQVVTGLQRGRPRAWARTGPPTIVFGNSKTGGLPIHTPVITHRPFPGGLPITSPPHTGDWRSAHIVRRGSGQVAQGEPATAALLHSGRLRAVPVRRAGSAGPKVGADHVGPRSRFPRHRNSRSPRKFLITGSISRGVSPDPVNTSSSRSSAPARPPRRGQARPAARRPPGRRRTARPGSRSDDPDPDHPA